MLIIVHNLQGLRRAIETDEIIAIKEEETVCKIMLKQWNGNLKGGGYESPIGPIEFAVSEAFETLLDLTQKQYRP